MTELLKDTTLSVMALRNTPILDRIEAAANAGFGGIGVRHSDYLDALRDGYSLAAIDEKLEEYDVQITEIEFLRQWIGQQGNLEYDQQEAQLFGLANHWNARHMNVGYFDLGDLSLDDVVPALTGLCQRVLEIRPATEQPLFVQSEFMPYTSPVNTLAKALWLIRAVGLPNAKLVFDTWHASRTDRDALQSTLLEVKPDEISCIQLSDCLKKPMDDVVEESRHYRVIPGEGGGNLAGWINYFRNKDVTAPLSTEVMSDLIDRKPSVEAAQCVANGLSKVFEAADRQSY